MAYTAMEKANNVCLYAVDVQPLGFINSSFCRNWAVGNPAGTMLDSLA